MDELDLNDVLLGTNGNGRIDAYGIHVLTNLSWQEGDKIGSYQSFGATNTNQFSFGYNTDVLSFQGQQFATLENINNLIDFVPASDMVLL